MLFVPSSIFVHKTTIRPWSTLHMVGAAVSVPGTIIPTSSRAAIITKAVKFKRSNNQFQIPKTPALKKGLTVSKRKASPTKRHDWELYD